LKLIAALLFASSVAAAAPPAEVAAEYTVTSTGMTVGHVSESFVRKGDLYSVQSVTRSEGPLKMILDEQITLESSGRLAATGLQPLEFVQRRARDSKRDLKSSFDWDKGVVSTVLRGETSQVALPLETQDRLSAMYQFLYLPAYGPTLAMPMAMGRRVEQYNYRLVEEGRLATPAGEFDTLHYARVVAKPDDTKVDVWLAKDRFKFPVRVIFDDPKGFRLEQTLLSLDTH
jgi:Protein of unknown function (DUF3108)